LGFVPPVLGRRRRIRGRGRSIVLVTDVFLAGKGQMGVSGPAVNADGRLTRSDVQANGIDVAASSVDSGGRRLRASVLMGIAGLLAVLPLASCSSESSENSVEAYCGTLNEHKRSYLASMEAASNPASAADILGGVAAVGDLKIMWSELADVSPDEIRADTENVRDTWADVENAAVNGDWASALLTGLLNAGSFQRVDAFVREHCDVAPEPPVLTTVTPEAAASSPAQDAPIVPILSENATSLGSLFVDRNYAFGDTSQRGGYATGPTTFESVWGSFEVSAEDLFPEGEIEYEAYSVGGTESDPLVVGLVVVRNPAQGLDPEYFETSVIQINMAGTLVASTPVAESDKLDKPRHVVGAVDSDAIISIKYDGGETAPDTIAYSTTDGSVIWEDNGYALAYTRNSVVVVEDGGDGCTSEVKVIQNATGNVLRSIGAEEYPADCLAFSPIWRVGAAVLVPSAVAERYFDLRFSEGAHDFPDVVVDSRTGELASLPATVAFADPLSTLVVSDWSPLIVMDAASGEEVFSLSEERSEALGADALFLLDRKLYLETTDAVLVIDCDSGEVTDDNASSYPIDFAGGIVKMADGTAQLLGSL